MASKNHIHHLTVLLVASIIPLTVLCIAEFVDAHSFQVFENFSFTSLPAKHKMRLIAFSMLTLEGRIAGGMAVYDDADTKRCGDYAEIYNPAGDLLAIMWLDRFGILRSAVDRGIVLNKHHIEGVLVLVLDGEVV